MEKSFDEKVAEAKAQVSALTPQQANARIAKDPTVVFLDPRNAADIHATTGIIPGALNVTLSDLQNKPDQELPGELADHSRSIIAACQGGPMGALAAHTLKQRGYNKVYFLDGGTQGWLDAGFTTR